MKTAVYGVNWIPVSLIKSFLKTDWNLIDITRNQMPYEEAIRENPMVIISFSPPDEILAHESIKWILTPGAGVDNMDLEKIRESGQKIVNCHANSSAVAEHAWAMLMAVARKIVKYHNLVEQKGEWPGTSHIKDLNTDLKGKNIGILGYGAIGKKLERYALAFEMNPMIFRLNPDEGQFFETELKEKASDIEVLMVACPLTEKTKELVSDEIFSLLPGQAIIVNVARGGVIDEKAMITALKEGKIRAAGIDTWQNSPYQPQSDGIKPSEFVYTTNLTISPHRAWVSPESFGLVAQQIAKELDLIAQSKTPTSLVDFDSKY